MAKIVQTTDEKVLKAARDFPKAEGLLKDLFPEVFPPEYVRGNLLTWIKFPEYGAFLVLDPATCAALNSEYGVVGSDYIRVIRISNGTSFTIRIDETALMLEKF